jgi:beta-galactosidase
MAALLLVLGTAPAPEQTTAIQSSPRERIAIDDGWRFTKGDPPGNAVSLLYDVRPDATDARDDRPADAQPQARAEVESRTPTIKRWILPTGNPFIKDPARRHARPGGNWGGEVAYVRPDFDDSSWRRVGLPHDWAIEGPFLASGPHGGMGRLPSWGVAWYRKRLNIPAADTGRSVFLDVDGAMSYATVWLNGQIVGGWPYGYASWRVDLTPAACRGRNQSRFAGQSTIVTLVSGGGICQRVADHDSLHGPVGNVREEVCRASAASTCSHHRQRLRNSEAVSVATRSTLSTTAESRRRHRHHRSRRHDSGGPSGVVRLGGDHHPRLWGPPPNQQPNRYVAVTSVLREGRLTDCYETRFGIRELRFDANQGVFVNGERIYLKGVNQHHDLGALGAAFNTRAAEQLWPPELGPTPPHTTARPGAARTDGRLGFWCG